MQVVLGFLLITYLVAIRRRNRSPRFAPWVMLGVTVVVSAAFYFQRFI